MTTPALTATLKGAISRNGYSGVTLARRIGLPYQTLNYRYRNPETWKFCEWAAMLRNVDFTADELEMIRKEIIKL